MKVVIFFSYLSFLGFWFPTMLLVPCTLRLVTNRQFVSPYHHVCLKARVRPKVPQSVRTCARLGGRLNSYPHGEIPVRLWIRFGGRG